VIIPKIDNITLALEPEMLESQSKDMWCTLGKFRKYCYLLILFYYLKVVTHLDTFFTVGCRFEN